MRPRSHVQLHTRAESQRRDGTRGGVDELEQLAVRLERRQDGKKVRDAWNDVTSNVEDALKQFPPSENDDGNAPVSFRSSSIATRDPDGTPQEQAAARTDQLLTESDSTGTAPPSEESAPASLSNQLPASLSNQMPASIAAPTGSVASRPTEEPLNIASDTPTPVMSSPTAAPESTTAAAASNNSGVGMDGDPSGSKTASKAGIAFGILGGLLAISLLIFFLFKRRREQMRQQLRLAERDEKAANKRSASVVPKSSTRRSSRMAPRLALAPTAAFTPLAYRPLPPNPNGTHAVYPKNAGGAWERPRTAGSTSSANENHNNNNTNHSNNPANPFGNFAERMDAPLPLSPMSNEDDVHAQAQRFSAADLSLASPTHDGPDEDSVAVGMLTRKQSVRKDTPSPLDLTLQPAPGILGGVSGWIPASPAATEYSMQELSPGMPVAPTASTLAIAAAGGPALSAVYRVELDFEPTMDDEMELRAGGLVRLLFEYDDGWALCIRLDRSHQGVVPRTCLSTRPVKPRYVGPPGQRPGPPIQTYRTAGPPVSMHTQGFNYPHPSPSSSPVSRTPPSPQGPLHDGPTPTHTPGSIGRKPVAGMAY